MSSKAKSISWDSPFKTETATNSFPTNCKVILSCSSGWSTRCEPNQPGEGRGRRPGPFLRAGAGEVAGGPGPQPGGGAGRLPHQGVRHHLGPGAGALVTVPKAGWSRPGRIGLNMELDLQSLLGLLCTAVLAVWDPATPPCLGSYTRALLVRQDRRHLFVTPTRELGQGHTCMASPGTSSWSSSPCP